jgi:phospholipid/cholesterol/gamma-HCH transport system substrate-binding protein
MRSNKVNYLIVGTFVLAMIGGLVVSVAMLLGQTGPTDSYYAIYRNVTGIKFGSQVFYEGYPIGQVTEVAPKEQDGRMVFRINFDVSQGWRIPNDSLAQVGAASLLSAVSLNIAAGDSQTALRAGEEISAVEASNLFDVVEGVAGTFANMAEEDLKPLLENLTRGGGVLADLLENDGRVIFDQARTLVEVLSLKAPVIVDQFGLFAGDLEDLGESLGRSTEQINALMTEDNRVMLEGVLGNLDQASATLDNLMAEGSVMIGSANDMMEASQDDLVQTIEDMKHTAATLARHIDSINHHLDGTSRNMYEFSRQIRQNPGLLLGGTPPVDNASE